MLNFQYCRRLACLSLVQAKVDNYAYVAIPCGKLKPGKVLKLLMLLYGLKQSPKNSFEHLKEQLEYCGFEQSNSDPCLFCYTKLHLSYLLCGWLPVFRTASRGYWCDTHATKRGRSRLQCWRKELSDVAGFFWVLLTELDNSKIELTQTVDSLDHLEHGLGWCPNAKETPAKYGALPADKKRDLCNEGFNYPSVVCMLIYLASNSRPDIAFVIHQCARFTHHLRLIHEQALKRIGRYLLGTKTRGLILDPIKRNDLGIDLFVDA